MSLNILSDNWRGHTAMPIDLDAIRFKVAPAPVFADCEGCIFARQRSAVCRRASEISGFDCEDALPDGRSGIFVIDRTDPRQIQMELEVVASGAEPVTAGTAPDQKIQGE